MMYDLLIKILLHLIQYYTSIKFKQKCSSILSNNLIGGY